MRIFNPFYCTLPVVILTCLMYRFSPDMTLAKKPFTSAFPVVADSMARGHFLHTATASNIEANSTFLDRPDLNNNPRAIITVTQRWTSTYNNHPIGVLYNASAGKWAVFNQDKALMPMGAKFNIVYGEGFIHVANGSNTTGSTTRISSQPDSTAILFETLNYNQGRSTGVSNTNNTGLLYNKTGWAVFNQNKKNPVPFNAAFNIRSNVSGLSNFVHTALASNTNGNMTYLMISDPNAFLSVSQRYNPNSVYNNNVIGVRYDNGKGKWAIFNQSTAQAMPIGASFNVERR